MHFALEERNGPLNVPARRAALLLFARWPEAGRVKTRLSPPLEPENAAALARALLLDAWDALGRASGFDRYLAFTPEAARPWFEALLPGADLVAQAEGDLGQRLAAALEAALDRGHSAALAMAADLPDLRPDAVEAAVAALDGPDGLVIAPSGDGGYSLIGLRRPHRGLFERIDWSTERVLAQTVESARELGLPVRLLDPIPDLDRPSDLARLRERRAGGPRTRAWIDADAAAGARAD